MGNDTSHDVISSPMWLSMVVIRFQGGWVSQRERWGDVMRGGGSFVPWYYRHSVVCWVSAGCLHCVIHSAFRFPDRSPPDCIQVLFLPRPQHTGWSWGGTCFAGLVTLDSQSRWINRIPQRVSQIHNMTDRVWAKYLWQQTTTQWSPLISLALPLPDIQNIQNDTTIQNKR